MNGKCFANDNILSDSRNTDIVNPFVHHLELTTTYEKIKAGLLTIFVLPIRLFVIVCLLICAWLLACIGLYGLTEEDLREKPITGWRRVLRTIVCLLMRGMMFALGFHWVHVKGRPSTFREAPVIAVAPHSSYVDILPVVCMGAPSVVTRVENLVIPFFGKLINYTQPVYVWREDPNSRQKTIQQIIDRATSKLDWSQVLIFPEGTCTNRSCLITFKPGAFYPGVPVQPVLLRYPNKLDTVTWTWEGPGVLKLMWLTLVQPHSNCEIEYLPVYKPNEEEKKDPKLYAHNVRQLMAKALGVPTLDYTYDDCQLVAKAKQLSLPRSSTLLQVHRLRIRIGLTRSQVEEKLIRNSPHLLRLNGAKQVTFAEFASLLQVPQTDHGLQELFNLFCKNGDNAINLREYLLSVILVSKAANKLEMFHSVFQMCGGKEEKLCKEEVITILKLVLDVNEEHATQIYGTIDTKDEGSVTYCTFQKYATHKNDLIGTNGNQKYRFKEE